MRGIVISGLAVLLLGLRVAPAQELWGLDTALGVDRIVQANCVKQNVCAAAPPLTPHAFPAGGSDWDTCTNTLWVTDGVRIVNLDKSCNVICSFPGNPGFGTWSGLAVDALGRFVYTVSSTGLVNKWAIGSGCLTFVTRCLLPPATPGNPYTGLAYDAFSGRLWVTDAVGRATQFAMAISNCQTFCTFQASCPNIGPVAGLAYDSCARLLYMYSEPIFGTPVPATVITNDVGIPGICGQTVNCCPVSPLSTPLSGIGFAPRKAATSTVAGCSGPGCPACNPVIGSQGLPILGGSGCFAVTLANAPCPSSAILYVSLGPCSPLFLGLCGPVFINPGTIVFFQAVGIGGCTGSCTGSASVPLPIPLAQTLCGLQLCAQWAILCSGGGLGLSGPLSIQLVGP